MGNLVSRYFNTNNKMYRFAVMEDGIRPGCLIAIQKWSNFKGEYIFDRYLSPQGYIELINEPDVKFDSLFEDLFDDEPKQKSNESLYEILRTNNIVVLNGFENDKYIRCRDKQNADKLMQILRKRFCEITI